jgi:putative heme transporter
MISLTRRLRRNWLGILAPAIGIVVLAVVLIVVVPRIANYADVWAAVKGVSWIWLAALVAAAAMNVLTFGPPYMAAVPGLRFRPALTTSLAATASTFIAPGGPAVGMGVSVAMLKAWGFPLRVATLAVTLTVLWNLFMTFGAFPAVSVALLTLTGGESTGSQGTTFVALFIFGATVGGFAIVLSNAAHARILGDFGARVVTRLRRVVRRSPVTWTGDSWVEFRASTLALVRQRWHWLTLATLLNHLTVFLTLLISLRALGVSDAHVDLAAAFTAWTISRVIGAIPITPGGFGIVEVGLTGALVAFGGSTPKVVAAVLVYRFLTVAPPLVIGVIAGALWSRHHPGSRADA